MKGARGGVSKHLDDEIIFCSSVFVFFMYVCIDYFID